MAFLHLYNRFILRPWRRSPGRRLVVVLGVALGVAVMTAIRLANTSVTDTFRAAVDSVSGNASLRIRGISGPLDERLLKSLEWLRDWGQVSPVIETYAMAADTIHPASPRSSFPRGELLHVLGVDVLLDFKVRDYHVLQMAEDQRGTAREVLSLLVDSRSVILTEKFLRRHRLRIGDSIRLVFDTREQEFTIRGALLDQGPARTLDGNFALMDIAGAQWSANRLGRIDYLDLVLPEGTELQTAFSRIQHRLPRGLVVEYPDAGAARADTMIAAFQFNLSALSAVSLVVGLFLIYNTISVSVASRREEIGILRALGSGQGMIRGLFLGEALLTSAVGLGVGLVFGRALAQFAVKGAAQTVETFYIAGVAEASASSLQLRPMDAGWVAVLTLGLSFLAAWLPAHEAGSVSPVEAARGTKTTNIRRPWRLTTFLGCVCLLLGYLLTWCPPVAGLPVLGFLAELMFMLGGALFTPLLLSGLCHASQRFLAPLFPRIKSQVHLAAANILSLGPRVSVSVAALGVSLAMMIAIAIMVGSFRETVIYWLNSALSSDLAVKPAMNTSAVSEARMSKHAVGLIQKDPDVVDCTWFTSRQVPYADRTIRLAVTDLEKTRARARLLFKAEAEPPQDEASRSLEPVMVSESFELLFNATCGSILEWPTPAGVVPLRIDAVYYDYASNQGTILMDAKTYSRWYKEVDPEATPQTLSLYLRPGANVDQVRQRLIRQLGDQEHLYCVKNAEVRQEALRIFESTFTVTYALQGIAIIVAGLGIASTLIMMIYDRRREIGLLTLVGATPGQTRGMILAEAVLLGLGSQLIGILVGFVLAAILIYVINVQSFGWTIQFRPPWSFLVSSTVLVLLASAVFGLYPAIRAAAQDPLRTVREE